MLVNLGRWASKIKTKFTRLAAAGTALFFAGGVLISGGVAAATTPFQLVPFEFVGSAADCGGTAGTDTVTAKWDNSTGNPSPSILLQKLGATSNCAAAGVDIITSLEGGPASALTELNFDYKTGEHCGAGAPRFNIQTDTGTAVTLGCSSGTQTPGSTPGWTHVEYSQAQIAAAVATAGAGTTLQDLYIIFDEGSDTPAGGTVGTPGTVHIDNISVNNAIVGSPTTPQNKNDCKNNGFKNFTDDQGNTFQNQGDCVSFVNSNLNRNRIVIHNQNKLAVTNHQNQHVSTGNARANNNTNGGNATSGNASGNSQSNSATVTVTNSSTTDTSSDNGQ